MGSIVQIAEGKVKGTTKTNLNGEKFQSFLCIPYGKAPVGNLRFKAPQPVEPWQGIKDATKQDNYCFQQKLYTNEYCGSEDCLTLHVFTKKLPKEELKLRPVMVFVHGGGFTGGTHETDMWGPEYLMTEDIVFVSITYRVGFLGFLSLNDPSLDVPGNAGLKDQISALSWIQRNIKSFNGDPKNVTVFGESAGGASVEYLVLSQSSKNLFHKAIMQSGSSFNPWARGNFDPADFGRYLGKPDLTDQELLRYMTEMSLEELVHFQTEYLKAKKPGFGNFGIIGPVVEKPNPSEFLTKEPIDVILSGDYNSVPVIIGYNDAEGLVFEFMLRTKMTERKVGEDIPIEKLLPYETNLNDAEQVQNITEKIRSCYFVGDDLATKMMFYTDSCFAAGILISAKNQAKVSKNPVYLYRFSFDGGLNFIKNMAQLNDFPGACHGDDLGYLFTSKVSKEIGELERITIQRMIRLWTNFAKYGNPTPKGNDLNFEWKPIQNNQINFLDFGTELKMDVNPEADRMKVWNEVYQLNPRTAKF